MFGKKTQQQAVPRRRTAQSADDQLPQQQAPGQYRRNQTLSGYKHTTPDESSRQKAHALTIQRRKLGGIFTIVAAIVVFLLLLLWQLIAQVVITTSTKQLTNTFDPVPYQEVVNSYLNVNPAQRLRASLNEADLSAFVAARHPEVASVALSGIPGVAVGNFAITFRAPVAGWQMNGKQYYVDEHGVVFEKNYYSAPELQIVDESGINPSQGVAVVGDRVLGFLGRVVAQAGERGQVVTRAVLPANTTRQMDVFLKDSPVRLKFSVDRGAGEQMEDAQRTLSYLAAHGQTPEYIDVRISGRAAYK